MTTRGLMMNLKKALFFAVPAVAFSLSACGDDSSTSSNTDDTSVIPSDSEESSSSSESDIIVDTFDDLVVCSDKREGTVAYVKDEKTEYTCVDGEWTIDDDNESSSSSVILSGGSAEVEGSSSSFKYEQDSTAYDTLETIAVKNKSIAGVSQKGPFVTGSAVKLYELDGETFAQTGKSFTGKITSDKGEFTVSSISLVSQYALLEANGYYQNEVSGSKSSGTITLNALTDLSDREKVNINLLTHLEYERAMELVNTGINVPVAKKQAEAEIFNAFGIQGEFSNSEDLSIFSEGDGNAALLAFSVLMLNDLSEADLTERMTKFATDVSKDGEWNDETTKAKIADWAKRTDLNGGLATIRTNIEGWNLGSVPGFEKYVRNFWYKNYDLGDCSSENEGSVLANKNERSSNYGTLERFICKSGAWVAAKDIEKDTYQWNAGEDGEIKAGDVISTNKYVYDGAISKWREASLVEATLGGCTETREADVSRNTGKVNGTWYICKSRVWESTNNITVDTQGWVEGSDGSLKKGDSTDTYYKYDESQDKWITANDNDVSLGLMGCTNNRTGEIGKGSNSAYYVCKNSTWQVAAEIDYDTYGSKCTAAEVGSTMNGVVTATNKYYCTANGWQSMMEWSWDVPKEARLNPDIEYGTMKDERDGQTYKTVVIGEQTWMAENLNYADSNAMPSLKGKSWCYDNNDKYCAVTGRLYTWAAAIDSVALANDADNPQTCGYGVTCSLPETVQGICPDGWRLPSSNEWSTLITTVGGSSSAGKILKSSSGWYDKGNGTDAYGFSALPSGYRAIQGQSYYAGGFAYIWSSTEYNSYRAYYLYLRNHIESSYTNYDKKDNAFAVRCLQD